MKEKERRNQALEISQQTLQKKLDGCVKDRTSLSEEVTTSTTKVNEVARIESKLERCKHDNLDLNAMTERVAHGTHDVGEGVEARGETEEAGRESFSGAKGDGDEDQE